jgi:hypothetical protein
MADITLKEVEEAVVKVVEIRPEAHYVVLVDESVAMPTVLAISHHFQREIGSYPIVALVKNEKSICILELVKEAGA